MQLRKGNTHLYNIERILDWRRANHKPLRLWDGGIGVAQLSDKEVHVIAHGWKFIQRDQRKLSRLRDGQGMDKIFNILHDLLITHANES